jgi:hypothetical protein
MESPRLTQALGSEPFADSALALLKRGLVLGRHNSHPSEMEGKGKLQVLFKLLIMKSV